MAQTGMTIGQGLLCLGIGVEQEIGRYNINGTNMNSIGQFDNSGRLMNQVGTSSTGFGFDVPQQIPSIGGVIGSGQTLHFQLWHRDTLGQSNLSNGLRVTF